MKKLTAIILPLALVFLLFSAGCGGDSGSDELAVIKVATATPLSGSNSEIGEALKNGAELALTERKEEFAQLGFDLQLSPTDDQADPKVGVSNAQRMVEDEELLAVVGHFNSGVAIPSSEVYETAGLVMVSPGNTATEVTDRGLSVVNRICARDDCQGPAGADFLYTELGCESVFIIQDKTAYGQGVADEFQARFLELGGEVLGYEGITQGEADFSAVEEMVRASGAVSVYFGGIYPEGSLLIKQFAEKGIDITFLGPDGIDSPEVVNIAAEAAIGVYYTTVAADSSGTAEGAAFAAKYQETFNKQATSWTGFGYDAMNVTLDAIVAAIEAAEGEYPTREAVAAAVRKTSGFKGIATNVTLNEIGDNIEASVYILGYTAESYPAAELISSVPVTDFLK